MCRVNLHHTFRHHITTSSLFHRLNLFDIGSYYHNRLLRWAGHVARMPELELIQTQMKQKPMLRAEVGMRVRCANKASAK